MGRCPVIGKRGYYARALFSGVLAAQTASMLALLALVLTYTLSTRRHELRADLETAAGRMLWIFLPYAALVLCNLALRLLPCIDIRSATSVFMLGPLTAIRPLVMIGGLLYGVSTSRLLATRLLGLFVLLLMLSLEFALNRRAARAQAIQIRQLI
jgi:hypothetical protein